MTGRDTDGYESLLIGGGVIRPLSNQTAENGATKFSYYYCAGEILRGMMRLYESRPAAVGLTAILR